MMYKEFLADSLVLPADLVADHADPNRVLNNGVRSIPALARARFAAVGSYLRVAARSGPGRGAAEQRAERAPGRPAVFYTAASVRRPIRNRLYAAATK